MTDMEMDHKEAMAALEKMTAAFFRIAKRDGVAVAAPLFREAITAQILACQIIDSKAEAINAHHDGE